MATDRQATARAHSNIAFIKYWGNVDDDLRLPANPSISMNLDALYTETTVTWDDSLSADMLRLNDQPESGGALERVSRHLDIVRQRLNISASARVASRNNFPMGAGIASSASAFAALTLAAVTAGGATLSERELTTLARRGSGSASRSIPAGFVQWEAGIDHETSYAHSVAAPEHWDLTDIVAIVSADHKAVGSTHGHTSAGTSDLQAGRLRGASARLEAVRQAIASRDFRAFAETVEHDSNLMHAVMMTSRPPLFYWHPASLTLMGAVRQWRAEGLDVCYTLDAGPNVHCICTTAHAPEVRRRLEALDIAAEGMIDILQAGVGGGAQVLD
ncbi:MAG: diphosphomevalonate decarboxylase [Anaerolineaceae bacterium]|nr:MAG: diphosphomevalonate decarboxylase [Anaerolineaceae bacterium]